MTTAWIFPGQGSQLVGMGRDVYDAAPVARDLFEQADALLDVPLSRLCFEGPQDELTRTENAQPALLTVCAALLAVLEQSGSASVGRPAFVAGHSLGEYSALLAAGVLDFSTALRLVRRRGELMAQADAGGMAAVLGMEAPALEAVLTEAAEGQVLTIANYNAPGQLVISGAREAVERAGVLAKAQGAKRVVPLPVSAAFHSPLMASAAQGLAPSIAEAELHDARMPVIGNVAAQPLLAADAIRQELVAQITAPVRWIASVEWLVAQAITTFVEIGPGNVLTGLVKRISPTANLVNLQSYAQLVPKEPA
jgi:[acyl-carrier-protein] S-malonyltransferase